MMFKVCLRASAPVSEFGFSTVNNIVNALGAHYPKIRIELNTGDATCDLA